MAKALEDNKKILANDPQKVYPKAASIQTEQAIKTSHMGSQNRPPHNRGQANSRQNMSQKSTQDRIRPTLLEMVTAIVLHYLLVWLCIITTCPGHPRIILTPFLLNCTGFIPSCL